MFLFYLHFFIWFFSWNTFSFLDFGIWFFRFPLLFSILMRKKLVCILYAMFSGLYRWNLMAFGWRLNKIWIWWQNFIIIRDVKSMIRSDLFWFKLRKGLGWRESSPILYSFNSFNFLFIFFFWLVLRNCKFLSSSENLRTQFDWYWNLEKVEKRKHTALVKLMTKSVSFK